MKIELIKTSEADGNWLKVKTDDYFNKCWQLNSPLRTDEEAMNEALKYFDLIVATESKPIVTEIIKSVEI
jgi:hypothetical protein